MRARKIDANQNEIVKKLRKHGCSVAVTSALGHGFPDLLVGYNGVNYLIELKDGSKPPSQRNLTPLECEFISTWRGLISVCIDFESIIKLCGIN